jgi:hypothetical protein
VFNFQPSSVYGLAGVVDLLLQKSIFNLDLNLQTFIISSCGNYFIHRLIVTTPKGTMYSCKKGQYGLAYCYWSRGPLSPIQTEIGL